MLQFQISTFEMNSLSMKSRSNSWESHLTKKLIFEEHIKDIVKRAFKRINLLKALKGRDWGASSEIILYTYRTYG